MKTSCRRLAAAALATFLLALAGPAVLAQESGPRIEHPWARATPGQSKTGAAYVTIAAGSVADKLIAVSTPVAGKTELHTASNDNGVMKMRPVDAIALPAGQTVELKPGGFHMMMLDLKQPLKEGERFPLTLVFEKAGKREVEVEVEKVGAAGPMGGMKMDGMPAPKKP